MKERIVRPVTDAARPEGQTYFDQCGNRLMAYPSRERFNKLSSLMLHTSKIQGLFLFENFLEERNLIGLGCLIRGWQERIEEPNKMRHVLFTRLVGLKNPVELDQRRIIETFLQRFERTLQSGEA